MKTHESFNPGLTEREFDKKYPDEPEIYYTYENLGRDLLAYQLTPEEVERGNITREKVRDIITSDLGRMVIERAKAEYLLSQGKLREDVRSDIPRLDLMDGDEIARDLMADASANPDETYQFAKRYAKGVMDIYGGQVIAAAEEEDRRRSDTNE